MRDDIDAFYAMASEYPVRTAIFTFGLPLFALLQLVNGFVHQGQMTFIAAFAVLAAIGSVVLTRYQISVYRRRTISRQWS